MRSQPPRWWLSLLPLLLFLRVSETLGKFPKNTQQVDSSSRTRYPHREHSELLTPQACVPWDDVLSLTTTMGWGLTGFRWDSATGIISSQKAGS